MNYIIDYFIIMYWLLGFIYTWLIGTKDMKRDKRIVGIFILCLLWPIFLFGGWYLTKRFKNKIKGL